MEDSPNNRIRAFLEHKGIKVAEAVRRTGIGQSTLYNVLNGKAKSDPSFETLQMMLTGFPDLNPDWLLTGSGAMLRDGKETLPVMKSEPVGEKPTPMGPVLVPETDYVKELKAQLKRAQADADTWRDLYLGRYTLSDAQDAGKLDGDNHAAGLSPIGFGYGKAAKGNVTVLGDVLPMMIDGRAFYKCVRSGELVAFRGELHPVVAQERQLKVA